MCCGMVGHYQNLAYRKAAWLDQHTIEQRLSLPGPQLRRFHNKWERKWKTDKEAELEGEYFEPLYLEVERVVASKEVNKRELLTR